MNKGITKLIKYFIIAIGLISFSGTSYASEPSAWAKEEVEQAIAINAVTDNLTDSYTDTLTKEEFVEIAAKMYEALMDEAIDIEGKALPFTDTDKAYITKAYYASIIRYRDDGQFLPEETITREEMVTILINIVHKVEETYDIKILNEFVETVSLSDEKEVAPWALESVLIACKNNLLSGAGDGSINPKGKCTKEQAIILTYRVAMMIDATEGYTVDWTSNLNRVSPSKERVTRLSTPKKETKNEVNKYGVVTVPILNMRSTPSLENSDNIIRKLRGGERLEIIGNNGEWYQVIASGNLKGYVYTEYVDILEDLSTNMAVSDIRKEVVNFALKHIGGRYVYGGTSLTSGVDCSGFTQQIFARFGYSLSRSSRTQSKDGVGVSVNELLPGDLVFYGYNGYVSHVAIYMGNGKIVHALNERKGIVTSGLYDTMNKPLITCRRIIK